MTATLHRAHQEMLSANAAKRRTVFRVRMARSLAAALILLLALGTPIPAEEPHVAVTTDQLRAEVADLEAKVAALETQNSGLRNILRSMSDDAVYLVVDTENNRLFIRQAEQVLRTVVVSTGSRGMVKSEDGRNWFFESPTGSLTVLGKERNPVWIRPDWSYVEENMPIPDKHDPDRLVRDVLGKYALLLGNGFKIHGTTYKGLLGTAVTHGCVSMDDADLEAVYKAATIGTKVYIY